MQHNSNNGGNIALVGRRLMVTSHDMGRPQAKAKLAAKAQRKPRHTFASSVLGKAHGHSSRNELLLFSLLQFISQASQNKKDLV
jgi:hypothetical protein